MKKIVFILSFFILASLYLNADDANNSKEKQKAVTVSQPESADKSDTAPSSALDKVSFKEMADMEVNTVSYEKLKKDYKKQTEAKTKEKQSPEFWMSKLDSPLLDKATKEKKSQKIEIPEKQSIWHVMAMYLPNRLIDLTDIFTFELGFGPQASLDLTFTKWFEFGGSYGDNYFVEKGYNRQYGGGYSGGYSYSGGWISQDVWFNDNNFGTVQNYIESGRENSLIPSPSEDVYKNGIKDFWKIGVHAGWIVNFGFGFHPLALANFFTGFALIRLTNTQEL